MADLSVWRHADFENDEVEDATEILIRGGVLFLTQAWVLLKWKFTQAHI